MAKNCCVKSSSRCCGISSENKLIILWQRLVLGSDTCPRCGSTGKELDKAIAQLKEKLNSKGFDVILEKKELTEEDFKRNPLSSNQILLNGKPLESWLNAETGRSKCCDVCGDEECRTTKIGQKSYEAIPASLIVEAGLRAISKK